MFVEQVIFQALENDIHSNIIAKNIQIIENGITLGEIDCIFQNENETIHLEIVYKFYLFDPSISNNQLNCWIGPNRKDSLIEKLNKLRDKQFPLLQHKKTKEELTLLNLATEEINQKVCFKAQLFIPANYPIDNIIHINRECIAGFYYKIEDLNIFKESKFYIPSKIEWLSIIGTDLKWINYEIFIQQIKTILKEKRSPLCFVKDKKGNLSKFFIVWW